MYYSHGKYVDLEPIQVLGFLGILNMWGVQLTIFSDDDVPASAALTMFFISLKILGFSVLGEKLPPTNTEHGQRGGWV